MSGDCQVRNWTPRNDNYWIHYPAISKNEKSRALLYFLWQIFQCYKVWRTGFGYGLPIFIRVQLVWFSPTSNEKRVELFAKRRLYGTISSQFNKRKFPLTCCAKHKKHAKWDLGLFKEEFRCKEKILLCTKTCCCYDSQTNKFNFSSKGLNKRTLEDWWWPHI